MPSEDEPHRKAAELFDAGKKLLFVPKIRHRYGSASADQEAGDAGSAPMQAKAHDKHFAAGVFDAFHPRNLRGGAADTRPQGVLRRTAPNPCASARSTPVGGRAKGEKLAADRPFRPNSSAQIC